MSDGTIFFFGVGVTVLCLAFAVISILELRRLGSEADGGPDER